MHIAYAMIYNYNISRLKVFSLLWGRNEKFKSFFDRVKDKISKLNFSFSLLPHTDTFVYSMAYNLRRCRIWPPAESSIFPLPVYQRGIPVGGRVCCDGNRALFESAQPSVLPEGLPKTFCELWTMASVYSAKSSSKPDRCSYFLSLGFGNLNGVSRTN